jgi:hypothetical protein
MAETGAAPTTAIVRSTGRNPSLLCGVRAMLARVLRQPHLNPDRRLRTGGLASLKAL